ncbi:restriction endonuclease subunit S, partial [Escherichia coli]
MSGNNKHMVVPQLRFPEFRNTAEWATYNLGQLSKIVTEKVGDNDCIPYTITSGVGLISQQEKL